MTALCTCVASCSHRQDKHGELFQAQPLEMENILRKGSKGTDGGIQMPRNAASLGSMKKRRLPD